MAQSRYTHGLYAAENPGWHDNDAPWKASQIARLVRDQQLDPLTLCDVGCGTGGVLAALSLEFPCARMVGYDISDQAAQLAEQLHPGIDVRVGDVTAATTELFDLVTLVDVFEHIEDYLGFLRSVARLGQRHIFHIPLDMNALGVARATPLSIVREKVGHLHYFSKDTALASLRDAGYTVEAYRYTAGTMELPHRSTRMKLMTWPRKAAFSLAPDPAVRLLGGFSLLVLARPDRRT